MDAEKNIYGLSEGVFKACQFLELKFPPKAIMKKNLVPSDYFGDDYEFDSNTAIKLRTSVKWTKKLFERTYKRFAEKFAAQKPLKKTKTDLNIYFCDFALFASIQNGAGERDYFNFEFYNKSFSERESFRTQKHRYQTRMICNEPNAMSLVNNKYETNALFSDFLHRDWINTSNCSFEEFKAFVKKHPRFFSKLDASSFGKGAQIINVAPDEDIRKLFAQLKRERRLLEEVITQHEDLAAFCPDSVNTIRVNTILDIHGVVHILTTSGKFGRSGIIVDNFNGGGVAAIIDPQTGIITSDAINSVHERFDRHPDTGKVFKGFQYPHWEKVLEVVTKMAKLMPQMRHVGWDITISVNGDPVLVEANGNPDPGSQQSADSVGRLPLYQPLLDEIQNYKQEQLKLLGYRVNDLRGFDSAYNTKSRSDDRLKLVLSKLSPDCKSLLDLGCREKKAAKQFCPESVQYFPVDFKAHDTEIIACNFNKTFSDITADTCLCALTAEYVETLPQFLANMCNAAQKQVLMLCCPVDRERDENYRWEHPFLIDFTEEFLIKTMEQNDFGLDKQYQMDNKSIILYDFRRKTIIEKNIYGLSEGVFEACKFLGLKFPPEATNKAQPVPSDYFGDDYEFDSNTAIKLRTSVKWTKKLFERTYKRFAEKFAAQKPLKKTKTDLNVYFCDYLLFKRNQPNTSLSNYLDFEFYNKPFSKRREFLTDGYNNTITVICNNYSYLSLANNKARTNELFANFLHRDWLNMRKCTFEEFSIFIGKHPRFFSKPIASSFGIGAKVISVNSDEDVKKVFAKFKGKGRLLEEIIVQHEDLAAFCPDTVNTIRINTILDIHNVAHILTTSGRFGRIGKVVDNFNGGGCSVVIDSKTGIVISDAVNEFHERTKEHPDTGKIFKGFQYPSWKKVRETVKAMAKLIPQLRRIAWDIAINEKGDPVIVEANGNFPGVNTYQVPDDTGRLHLYRPLVDEIKNYKKEQIQQLGYHVNNLRNFDSAYDNPSRQKSRLQYAMIKLVPDCTSLMDLGCRKDKFVKSICPANVKYFPVDFKKYDDEVIACDFNDSEFPDIKADTILCAFTAEFVENLPQFLASMCNAAHKQILMWCRPIDKENNQTYRWKNPFLTDFTEEFLISTMTQNNFQLNAQSPASDNRAIILYDFRKT